MAVRTLSESSRRNRARQLTKETSAVPGQSGRPGHTVSSTAVELARLRTDVPPFPKIRKTGQSEVKVTTVRHSRDANDSFVLDDATERNWLGW